MKVTAEKKVTVTLELTGEEAHDLMLVLGSLSISEADRLVRENWHGKRFLKSEEFHESLYFRLEEALSES